MSGDNTNTLQDNNDEVVDTKQILHKFVDSTVAQDNDTAAKLFSDVVKTMAINIKNSIK